jgi:hypothetical protein
MKDVLERATITMDPHVARKAFLSYRTSVRDRLSSEDEQIMRGYRALSKGQQLINLREAISAGGTHPNGLPRLAVARADTEFVYAERNAHGSLTLWPNNAWNFRGTTPRSGVFRFPTGTLPTCAQLGCDMARSPWDHSGHQRAWGKEMRAMVPNVPMALRPAHALSGYATLFEVDKWEKAPRPPGDPALLKHVGGELWAVLAVWDLTPLEQAVLSGRLT